MKLLEVEQVDQKIEIELLVEEVLIVLVVAVAVVVEHLGILQYKKNQHLPISTETP